MKKQLKKLIASKEEKQVLNETLAIQEGFQKELDSEVRTVWFWLFVCLFFFFFTFCVVLVFVGGKSRAVFSSKARRIRENVDRIT